MTHPWHPLGLAFRLADRLARAHDAFRVERIKARMKRCGERVYLSPRAIIWSEPDMSVGDDVSIHSFSHIFAGGGVEIGDGTLISACCSIASVSHPVEGNPRHALPLVMRPVVIGRNVWLGTGAIVLPGVTIGDHAVIGAGAVVIRDVPARTVVAGNPAGILREIAVPEQR